MSGYREAEDAPVLVAAFNGKVFGMERGTGRVLWEQPIPYGGSVVALHITASAVFAATMQGLVCLRYPDGAPLWAVPTSATGRASLLVDGGRIFVARAGEVESFTLEGQPVWRERFTGKGMGEVSIGVPGNVVQADERG